METTVANTKSEATQLQKQLQARVFTDSDNNSKLQMNSTNMAQNFKGNETKLKNLERESAQIQLNTGQVCNAKGVLLGDLDFISPEPSPGHLLQSLQTLLRQLTLINWVSLQNYPKKR